MNILEHDSEGKYYHEYISRGSRSNKEDTIIVTDRSSSSSTSSVTSSELDCKSDENSKTIDENSATDKEGGNIKLQSESSHRMEIGSNSGDLIANIKQEQEDSSSEIFTCENCSKTAYTNGEFETIKLGDIFTHITQFPSSEGIREGPRLCAQCLNSDHQTGDQTAHDNNIHHNISVINSNIIVRNSNHNSAVVASTHKSDARGVENDDTSLNNGESSAQLLQGVSTINMQNSNLSHHPQQLQHSQFQHQQQHQPNNQQAIISHTLQQSSPPGQEMHHDHQQHFYQQGGQVMQQVKLEPDLLVHSQQQPHNQTHLDNFMLIPDSTMFPDNNDGLQQQHLHQTMVSFHHQQQVDNHLHENQQQRQQVICDNQQQPQQQEHQSAIQHITVVTPGSDIKYTIPTAVMQMQGKEPGGMDQSQGQHHLIQFTGQNHVLPSAPQHPINGVGGGGGHPTNVSGGTGVDMPANFQFIELGEMENSKSSNPPVTTMITSTVVTHTASTTSSIISIPSSTVATSSTTTTNSKTTGSKVRTNKSVKSGPGAKSNKTGDAQQGETPRIPCDLCKKKKFKNPKMAMNHYKRVHQKEPRFVCEICGAVFSYR